jgi:hypothetical protein
LLLLDRPLDQQQQAWQHKIDGAGTNLVAWRNLATEARQAVRAGANDAGGAHQAWRYAYLMTFAPSAEVVEGIYKLAADDDVLDQDLHDISEERLTFLASAATEET